MTVELKNTWPWWQAIKDWWNGTTGRYLIVYPPAGTNEKNFKPWEYPREPDVYKTFWEAHREAEFINKLHGKVIAIVAEFKGDGPLPPAKPPQASDLPPKPDAPPQYHRTRKKKNYRSIDD